MPLKKLEASEAEIQDSIMKALSFRKIGFFWRQNNTPVYDEKQGRYRSMSKFATRGVSDILGVYKGRFIAIEVKTRKAFGWHYGLYKKISAGYMPKNKNESRAMEQIIFIDNINKNGGLGFFACSLEKVLEKLDEL